MKNNDSQQIKAQQFHKLHHSGEMLLLPNIWDPLGALLLENLQYPAIATASASIAFSNGYDDGENTPFNYLLTLLTNIVNSVDIPVTADIESAYASNDTQLQENIKQLISTGIVGINIEDTDKETNALIPAEIQCNRIRIIKKTSADMGISLFINARTDTYIHGNDFETDESKLEETLKRGFAYKSAGGIPNLDTLNEMGVARVSLGPSFLKIAMRAMKDIAVKLKSLEGLSEITNNEISSDFLKNLVNKNG